MYTLFKVWVSRTLQTMLVHIHRILNVLILPSLGESSDMVILNFVNIKVI